MSNVYYYMEKAQSVIKEYSLSEKLMTDALSKIDDALMKYEQMPLRLTQQDDFAITQLVFRTPSEPIGHAPHVHRVFSNLKAWLNGRQHGVNPWYLKRYLDEFDFPFQPAQHANGYLPDPAGYYYPENAAAPPSFGCAESTVEASTSITSKPHNLRRIRTIKSQCLTSACSGRLALFSRDDILIVIFGS